MSLADTGMGEARSECKDSKLTEAKQVCTSLQNMAELCAMQQLLLKQIMAGKQP